MKRLLPMKIVCMASAAVMLAGAAPVGPEWKADALIGWTGRTCQLRKAKMENGVLKVVCGGSDAQLYSPSFSLAASASQEVVFRAKGDRAGTGELFWMTPGKGPTQNQSSRFAWIGDGKWHEYRVRPYWQGEKTIGGIRLDLPTTAADGGAFEIESVRVEEVGGTIAVDASKNVGVTFSLAAAKPSVAEVLWAGGGESGVKKHEVRVPGDGRRHRYFLNLAATARAWAGTISLMEVKTPEGVAAPTDLRFVGEEPVLPADVVVKRAHLSDAFNRAGGLTPVTILVENLGTECAKGVCVVPVGLPADVKVNAEKSVLNLDVFGCELSAFTVALESEKACEFDARFEVRAPGADAVSVTVPVKVLPSLGLAKADYVPAPKPAETDFDIAALYFPGWAKAAAWERVSAVCPERKPVLGWYDEANPECIDWQIKWLVENGIRTLYVDWYWHKGAQHLDHWVKSFYRAKYKSCIKWAMMWANHNAAGSHSVADQRAVTKFWIENYFNTPEYLRIDGMPVVWMWSPQNMDRDAQGEGGCRKLLDVSREMARAAGFKGIHFIAMKWPEEDCSPRVIQGYKDMGFDMTGIYHFMSHGGRFDTNRRYPFSAVADANPENWWKQHEAGVLPFLPNISTGWDDRPWKDHCEIYGKNVDDFRRICMEAKRFAEKTGVRRLCLSPLNEWGEGSYAEPNAEHGFGFYEAVRDTFCKKPAEGWPLNYGPKDVGLGPYDLPPSERPKHVTEWDFRDAKAHGWHSLMNTSEIAATAEGIAFESTAHDPAVVCSFAPAECKRFSRVVVKMKVTGPDSSAQLFWTGPGGQVRERASVSLPVRGDGQFREYAFAVAGNREWRARVNHFRFDPVSAKGCKVVIESVRMGND